ncbi:MAG: DUF4332 domain-containing protein [Holophagales bacterium]|nr:DUF4332 domain-containing protein [Holophagales bacterium]MYH26611.1 DUF4332 domain-containing protein [Holophagales bacterium]
MPYGVRKIGGVGPAVAAKLAKAGIRTTDGLLAACRDRRERRLLSERTGLPERQIQRFVNRADLMRIRGVGGDFAELLVASGVRTVRELSRRRPLNLALKVSAVNAEKKLSRRAPSASMVERWIAKAKELKEAAR